MTRFEVDRACGQTPCLCGDIETWHIKCYEIPSHQIEKAIDRAYRIARRKLKERAKAQAEHSAA